MYLGMNSLSAFFRFFLSCIVFIGPSVVVTIVSYRYLFPALSPLQIPFKIIVGFSKLRA